MVRVVGTVVLALLGVPALLLAVFSFFLLDAPWASRGTGAALILLMIVCCWALAGALLVAAWGIWLKRWSIYRAVLLPMVALAALAATEWSTHALLQQCVFWCN